LPLSGKVGFKGLRKDATGSQIVTENSIEVNAKRGVDLITTIDKRVQLIIEDNLERGISKYGAMGGSVTVIDPMTGDILGMASFPSFDPANYQNYNDALFKNPVITDTFEPGSIFKVLIMAIGLDTGKVEPDTKCDICSEPFKIDKYFIKTWNNKYTDGINMTDVIVHSDNVGMVYVGQKVGQNELFDYLDKFGIGKKTGIDLQGEVALSMRPRGRWSDVDMATTTFGQGIAITGIEMLRAVSVIANGGYSITPRVVKALGGDGWREDLKPSQGERILKEKSAKETALMMVEAVNRGEAQWAKPKGFNNIAGKTGTAQIAVSGQYDEKNTNHSFIGFAPYDKPKFAMLVTLKSPQNSPWAAETAAPLWFAISKELFPYLGVMPD
jgi:cell division protein FtsI/penicillin-binding protein 2